MRDLLKLSGRMALAFVAIVLLLSVMQRWDDADTQRVRISMSRGA